MRTPDLSRCLLCSMIDGTVKAEVFLETPRILAVGNLTEPFAPGHRVFFPRLHVASLHEVDDETLREILPAVKRVAEAMQLVGYNVLQNNGALAGQTVFDAHVHLIPKPNAALGLRRAQEAPNHVEHGTIFQGAAGAPPPRRRGQSEPVAWIRSRAGRVSDAVTEAFRSSDSDHQDYSYSRQATGRYAASVQAPFCGPFERTGFATAGTSALHPIVAVAME